MQVNSMTNFEKPRNIERFGSSRQEMLTFLKCVLLSFKLKELSSTVKFVVLVIFSQFSILLLTFGINEFERCVHIIYL